MAIIDDSLPFNSDLEHYQSSTQPSTLPSRPFATQLLGLFASAEKLRKNYEEPDSSHADSSKRTMEPRVAVRHSKNPHWFRVIPLRSVEKQKNEKELSVMQQKAPRSSRLSNGGSLPTSSSAPCLNGAAYALQASSCSRRGLPILHEIKGFLNNSSDAFPVRPELSAQSPAPRRRLTSKSETPARTPCVYSSCSRLDATDINSSSSDLSFSQTLSCHASDACDEENASFPPSSLDIGGLNKRHAIYTQSLYIQRHPSEDLKLLPNARVRSFTCAGLHSGERHRTTRSFDVSFLEKKSDDDGTGSMFGIAGTAKQNVTELLDYSKRQATTRRRPSIASCPSRNSTDSCYSQDSFTGPLRVSLRPLPTGDPERPIIYSPSILSMMTEIDKTILEWIA